MLPNKPVSDDLAGLKKILAALDPSEPIIASIDMARYSVGANKKLIEVVDEEIAKVNAAMDSDDPKFLEYDLPATLHILADGRKVLCDYKTALEKRLEHGLKNLKQKGLWSDGMRSLSDLTKKKNLTDAYTMVRVVWAHMGDAMAQIGNQADLDDNSWKIGLELAFMQHAPDVFKSDQLFGLRIREIYPYIAVNAVMAAYAAKLGQVLSSDAYIKEISEFIFAKHANNPEIMSKMFEDIEAIYADEIKNVDQENRRLKDRVEKLEAENHDLRTKLEKANQANNPEQRQMEKLTDEKGKLAELLAEAQSQANLYRNAMTDRDRRISDLSARIAQSERVLIPPPDDNVIFLGGHINLVNKLKERHPNWKFIDGDDNNFPEFTQSPALIIFWDKHMSHSAGLRIRSLIAPSTKTIYAHSTNLDLLESEIANAWTSIVETDENK